jgi:hypothetical protein
VGPRAGLHAVNRGISGIEPWPSSSRTDQISGVTEKPRTSQDAQKVADTIIQPLNPAVQKASVVYNASRVSFVWVREVKVSI